VPAEFRMVIRFASIDGRAFSFEDSLRVESVEGHSHWQIYGIDDVARRLKDIAEILKAVTGTRRMRVETYDADDREAERQARDEQIRHHRQQDTADDG
jgi:hypothetical protein